MKKILNFIVFVTVVSLSLCAFSAEKMKEATVEYSADMVIDSGQGAINSKTYHALGGKDRLEMSVMGSTQIMITRQDKKVGWMLMPSQKTFMEMSLEESTQKSGSANINDCDMDMSSQGDETVNGVKATKSKVSMTCPDNVKYDGTMWVTKEGIMVKMDAVMVVEGNQANIKIDLKNLKIGTQDPSLFEIPAGYSKFSMGDISSMFKNAQEQAAKAQAAQESEEADEGGVSEPESSESSDAATSVDKVDNTADKTNETLDTTDKVKGTINRLKGLFGK